MITTDALKYLSQMGLDPSRVVGCAGEGVMRRSQVCKHQVCDYCGERFDMLTQRWWGNTFCKRTCKDAYFRENGVTHLAAALAAAVLMLLLLASANAAPSEEQAPAGVSLEFNKEDGTLYIDLSGPIMAGTADDVRAAKGKYGTALNRVVLFLDSAGGRVDDGDRLIKVLNEIKLRHQLITVVPHGKLCASMCIPIFLQGEDRLAAPASIWLFHEASLGALGAGNYSPTDNFSNANAGETAAINPGFSGNFLTFTATIPNITLHGVSLTTLSNDFSFGSNRTGGYGDRGLVR